MTKHNGKENVVFKKSPGPTAKLATPQVKPEIQGEFTRHSSITVAVVARKIMLPQQYTSVIEVRELGITARVKQRAPKYEGDHEGFRAMDLHWSSQHVSSLK